MAIVRMSWSASASVSIARPIQNASIGTRMKSRPPSPVRRRWWGLNASSSAMRQNAETIVESLVLRSKAPRPTAVRKRRMMMIGPMMRTGSPENVTLPPPGVRRRTRPSITIQTGSSPSIVCGEAHVMAMTMGSTMTTRPMCVPDASATPRQAAVPVMTSDHAEGPLPSCSMGSARAVTRPVVAASTTTTSGRMLIAMDCRTRTPQTHFSLRFQGPRLACLRWSPRLERARR